MKKLIEQFPEQLATAIQIGKASKLTFKNKNFNQVCVSGLGGSGIGASIVQDYVFDKLTIPFVTNKNYFIPKSVNEQSLFIACSYSGNTEETIQALKFAIKAKSDIVCITSGGELVNFAKRHKLNLIEIPAGNPPRASLGYSLVQLLYVLKQAKLLKTNFEKEINSSISSINKDTKKIQKEAKKIAEKLVGKTVAIYSMVGQEGLAIRFRQQLNENSKSLAWHNVIPEMTHNEIVGWKSANTSVATIFCSQEGEYEKNSKRSGILKSVVKSYNSNISEIVSRGSSYWEKAFYFIHLTDWISLSLAELNKQDAGEVRVIDKLKSKMAEK